MGYELLQFLHADLFPEVFPGEYLREQPVLRRLRPYRLHTERSRHQIHPGHHRLPPRFYHLARRRRTLLVLLKGGSLHPIVRVLEPSRCDNGLQFGLH